MVITNVEAGGDQLEESELGKTEDGLDQEMVLTNSGAG